MRARPDRVSELWVALSWPEIPYAMRARPMLRSSGVMILARLKKDTCPDHEAVEQLTRVMDPDLSLDVYRDYLVRMGRVHDALEPGLAAVPGLSAVVPDLDERWKSPLVRADLARLGSVTPPQSTPARPLASVAHALGCLYVLEGSTLGARHITRHVDATLGSAVADARRYLTAYGERSGTMWKRFGEALESWCAAHGQEDAVIAGAKDTFGLVREAMVAR